VSITSGRHAPMTRVVDRLVTEHVDGQMKGHEIVTVESKGDKDG